MDDLFDLSEIPLDQKVYLEAQFVIPVAPSKIVADLSEFVIGQEEAKKAVAVTVVNHDLIVEHNKLEGKLKLRKSNLLLVGPSGSGKTYLVETLGRILKKKVMIVDITSFTQAGYVGRDVDSILKEAVAVCNDKIEDVENMIIFIDEIDKLSTEHGTGKTGTLAVQQQLLKLIEGQDERPITDHLDRIQGGSVNTNRILWMFGGAFTSFIEEKRKKLAKNTSIGFKSSMTTKPFVFDHEALIEAGILRELAGRIGQIVELSELTESDYLRILTEPVDSLTKQYKKLGELRGINLTLTTSELQSIIKEAMRLKTGARGLKNVCDQRLRDKMYY